MSASVSTTENQLSSSTPGRDIEATAEASKAHSLAPSSVKSETFPSNNRAVDGEPREEGGVEGILEDSEQRNSDPPESHLEEKDPEVRHGPFFVEPLRSSGQSQTRFGIRGSRRHASGVDPIKIASGGGDGGYIGAFDYDKKYPADKYREEMGPEARVWKIYLDEAAEEDRFRIDNLRDTLDVILVFAGLFSAVVTTFVVHTVESLEGNSSWETTQTSLLTEMICIQRSVAAGTPLDACESSSSSHQEKPPERIRVDYLTFSEM